MGSCDKDDPIRFPQKAVDKTIVESGVILIKYRLEMSAEEQRPMLEQRLTVHIS